MKMKLTTGLLIAAALLPLPSYAGWSDYFGTHYSTVNWGNTIRDSQYSMALSTAPIDPLSSAQITTLTSVMADNDVVLLTGGFNPNEPHLSNYMNGIEADAAAKWRSGVYERATTFYALQGEHKVYIQIGNEINSAKHSESLHVWLKDGGKTQQNDPALIPYYVEYLLAPTVAELNKVADSTGITPEIVLGSIAAYANKAAAPWLTDLLNYKIVGTYAPELAGKFVYELVDGIGVHYLTGVDNDYWATALTDVQNNWIGKGRIKRVWSTEEGGVQASVGGHGAVSTLRAFSRYLSWWQTNNIPAQDRRCIFWGTTMGPEGTRITDVLDQISAFTGDTELKELISNVATTSSNIESRAYLVKGQKKRLVTLLPLATTSLNEFTVKGNKRVGVKSAIAHVYSASGHETYTLGISESAGTYTLAFPKQLELTSRHAINVEITH